MHRVVFVALSLASSPALATPTPAQRCLTLPADPDACFTAGLAAVRAERRTDATRFLRRGCALGHAMACHFVRTELTYSERQQGTEAFRLRQTLFAACMLGVSHVACVNARAMGIVD